MIKDNKLTAEELNNDPSPTVPKLTLVKGGKDNGGFGENWLSELPVGTIFLSRPNNSKDLFLSNFMLARHSNSSQSTNLRWAQPDDRVLDIWVPTLEFSRQNKLHEVIATILNYEEQENKGDQDDSDRPILDGRLPDDAEPESRHRLDAPERNDGE